MDVQYVRESSYPLLPYLSNWRQSEGQTIAQYDKEIMFSVTFEGSQPQPQW